MFIHPTGTAMPVSGMGISLQNLFFGAHRVFYGGAVDHTPPLWLQPSPPSVSPPHLVWGHQDFCCQVSMFAEGHTPPVLFADLLCWHAGHRGWGV